ncbi:amyloid-beta-like protein isoform X2 [Monomorium pharaonis]|uniref:amyloid-beta-like protein isoform X2 n=1 Tax=Monomorium pharaonis TaxID=307658 RepID=UPI00174736E9|nr:amyloid-beta-like protein isoform X2 [Monomorium pharaonis]
MVTLRYAVFVVRWPACWRHPAKLTPDPYLTHFDPRSEHQSYKQAQMRLEEVHKEKVTKDWSDLEERYQDIRAHDPVAADAFKRWMTARFQETVAALEESGAGRNSMRFGWRRVYFGSAVRRIS